MKQSKKMAWHLTL